jgi:hypothetical protein
MVEVGTMVKFVIGSGRNGAIGQILALDEYETQPAPTYRVLLLVPSESEFSLYWELPGNVLDGVDASEIELYE